MRENRVISQVFVAELRELVESVLTRYLQYCADTGIILKLECREYEDVPSGGHVTTD